MRWLLHLYPGDGFFQIAAYVLVQTTVIVLLSYAVSRLFLTRKAASRYAVWLCALLCILVSPVLAWTGSRSGFSVVEIPVHYSAVNAGDAGVAPAVSVMEEQSQPSPGSVEASPQPSVVTRGESTEEYAQAAALSRADLLRAVLGAFFAVWLAGALFFLVRLIFGFGVHAALRRSAQPLEMDGVETVLGHVRRILGVSQLPSIGSSVLINSPVSIGISNPLIILPQSLAYALGQDELRDVLVHEVAHVLHRDHAVNLLQRFARILLWPQPLLRILNRELATAREEVCDNHVLSAGKAPSYARTLLGLAEHTTLFHRAPASVGLAHPRWKLEDRVAGILDKNRALKTGISSVVFGGIVVSFLAAVIAIAACRIVRADSGAAQDSHSLSSIAAKEKAEKEIGLCLDAMGKASFEERMKKSMEALKGAEDISRYLMDVLKTRSETQRELVVGRLLRASAGLLPESSDIDTIIFKDKDGRNSYMKIASDGTGKPAVIDPDILRLLRENPTPDEILTAVALETAVRQELRIQALGVLSARGTKEAVKSLIGLLGRSRGAMQVEIAKSLGTLTGRRFGPDETSTVRQVEQALGRWNRWWEENKQQDMYRFDR